jgi:hypothetical protein
MDTVKMYTKLMLTRRGYVMDTSNNMIIDTATKQNGNKVLVYFFQKQNKTDKVNINVVKYVMSTAKNINHIIIVHDTVLTPDAKQHMLNTNSIFTFEMFTFDELMYDLLEIQRYPPEIKVFDKPPPNTNKIPILCTSDPLARYFRMQTGNVVQGRFGDNIISLRRCV